MTYRVSSGKLNLNSINQSISSQMIDEDKMRPLWWFWSVAFIPFTSVL